MSQFETLVDDVSACRTCTDRFVNTTMKHDPRPVFWIGKSAAILVSGQAPGMRVYKSGVPFDDASGDRLRDWMGLSRRDFYDRDLISILPMAFCFPGYSANGSDLPPPPICAKLWHQKVMNLIEPPKLTLLVGGHAQKYYLGKGTVTKRVQNWRDFGPDVFPLPHPSWRNTGWLKKNPWFLAELIPALQQRVQDVRSQNE